MTGHAFRNLLRKQQQLLLVKKIKICGKHLNSHEYNNKFQFPLLVNHTTITHEAGPHVEDTSGINEERALMTTQIGVKKAIKLCSNFCNCKSHTSNDKSVPKQMNLWQDCQKNKNYYELIFSGLYNLFYEFLFTTQKGEGGI